jgi:Kef-type K+ transport system membrane component KefB
MVFLVRPVVIRFARRAVEKGKGELSVNALSATLVLMCLCGLATNRIGIFAVFGAFFLGAVLSSEEGFRDAVNRRLRDFVTSFFMPVFFAYTGLRTRIDTLESWQLWALAAVVSGAAILGKLGGCSLAARSSGLSWPDSACIGCLMNTRGLMELIVINLGKDLGVIPDSVFCMLVLMAIVTTFMTTPLLVRLARGSELEGLIQPGEAEAQSPQQDGG